MESNAVTRSVSNRPNNSCRLFSISSPRQPMLPCQPGHGVGVCSAWWCTWVVVLVLVAGGRWFVVAMCFSIFVFHCSFLCFFSWQWGCVDACLIEGITG